MLAGYIAEETSAQFPEFPDHPCMKELQPIKNTYNVIYRYSNCIPWMVWGWKIQVYQTSYEGKRRNTVPTVQALVKGTPGDSKATECDERRQTRKPSKTRDQEMHRMSMRSPIESLNCN